MSGTSAVAAFAGLLLGIGLWLTFVRLPVMRRTTFSERVAPQLRSAEKRSRLLASEQAGITPFGPLEQILRPLLRDAAGSLGRLNLGNAALARRLARAGSPKSPVDFRAEQLLWAGAAFVAAALAAAAGAVAGRLNPVFATLMVLAATSAGFMARDYVLGSAIAKRKQRILGEFPAVADMMALTVGAGETAAGALDRTSKVSRGELAREFAHTLADTRSGTPLVDALHAMADRVDLAPITRFVDGLVVAVERGTPLADVLRAQAQDVRDLAKRDLMEAAGKKEIGMMVPLVFGVLPLTVVFAVYPGVAAITLGF
ncbi:pilus assembly protein TadB [Sinomonas cellulolyticus]|nr:MULTISPECIES: type II secretion system F family protein [Sinomonas]GHG45423.1 pilus assembly protein TadB [Sinomonas sp. KCTC 49339]